MKDLLVVGSVAFDFIETIFAKSGKILGGAGTYISLSASFFDIDISLISVVGNDFPQKFIDIFKQKKIDISGLQIKNNGKTFFWRGRYEKNMNFRHTIKTELNVLADFNPIVPDNALEPKILMLGNLMPQVQLSVIKQLKTKPQLIVLDTMDFWIKNNYNDLLEVLKYIDILTINEDEIRLLTDEYFITKAAKKVFPLGPKFVIVKKGDNGSALFSENGIFLLPAFPLEDVYDPTGAGDTFAGALCGYLAKTKDFSFENIKNAMVLGTTLASFVVESFGTFKLLDITKQDISERLQKLKNYTSFKISNPIW